MSELLETTANSASPSPDSPSPENSSPDNSRTVSVPSAGQPLAVHRSLWSILWWPVHLATLLVAGVALAGYCGRLGWFFELASHFRLQYGLLLAASSIGYLIGRHWCAGVAAGFLSAANLCLLVSVGSPPPRPEDRTVVRAILFNVLCANPNHEQVVEYVRATNPDLIMLLEVNFDWAASLRALEGEYPYRRVAPAHHGWGMALLSRIPLDLVEQTMIGGDENALAMVARLRIDGQALTLIGTHPWSPVTPIKLEYRNRQLADLAALAQRQRGPVMLLADLNTSPWSPYFQDLLSASRLRDSRQGFGIQSTWPTFCAAARIPIDHCLVSPEIAVHDRSIGPNLGSDHLPVVVDFSIWPQAGE